MPIATSTSARPPNAPSNQAPSRAAYSDVPIASVIVWMLGTGRWGSQILPEIAQQVAGGDSRRDWRRMRLSERSDVARQRGRVTEVAERQLRGLFRRRTARNQLAPAVIKMLRELVDGLALARR